jgi:hypothetical protein
MNLDFLHEVKNFLTGCGLQASECSLRSMDLIYEENLRYGNRISFYYSNSFQTYIFLSFRRFLKKMSFFSNYVNNKDYFSQLKYILLHKEYFPLYRGADKFLARTGRKQATVTEDFYVRISYL